VTRAVADADLDDLVNGVAARIASFDKAAIVTAKGQISRSTLPPAADLWASWAEFAESVTRRQLPVPVRHGEPARTAVYRASLRNAAVSAS
jgi:hypothetical protein